MFQLSMNCLYLLVDPSCRHKLTKAMLQAKKPQRFSDFAAQPLSTLSALCYHVFPLWELSGNPVLLWTFFLFSWERKEKTKAEPWKASEGSNQKWRSIAPWMSLAKVSLQNDGYLYSHTRISAVGSRRSSTLNGISYQPHLSPRLREPCRWEAEDGEVRCEYCFRHNPAIALAHSLRLWLPAQDQANKTC